MSAVSSGGTSAELLPDGECNSIFKLLPNEIKIDILSRLHFDLLLDCKLVCKSWCKTIQNPTFAKIHLRQQQQQKPDDKVRFLLLNPKGISRLYYGTYDENTESCAITTVNYPSAKMNFAGSCNGLVCFSVSCTHKYQSMDPIYICNPSMGEQITLPRLQIKKNSRTDSTVVSGFGYNSSTDEYKVVRIYYAREWGGNPKAQVEVYTLGSGTGWRNVGICTYSLFPIPRNVLVDGALHWLDAQRNVVAFDLKSETFSLLPSPPCFLPDERNFYELQELGGCLCVVNDNARTCLDIWSFKKETNGWAKMFEVPCAVPFGFYLFLNAKSPVSLTSSGNLILRCGHYGLASYDPKTRELKELMNCNLSVPARERRREILPCAVSIPHMNSFVTLKSLGETSKKILRARVVDDLPFT